MVGFKNVVERWLKTKRCRLKVKFQARMKECPMNIDSG
jgi:hypothetical protein